MCTFPSVPSSHHNPFFPAATCAPGRATAWCWRATRRRPSPRACASASRRSRTCCSTASWRESRGRGRQRYGRRSSRSRRPDPSGRSGLNATPRAARLAGMSNARGSYATRCVTTTCTCTQTALEAALWHCRSPRPAGFGLPAVRRLTCHPRPSGSPACSGDPPAGELPHPRRYLAASAPGGAGAPAALLPHSPGQAAAGGLSAKGYGHYGRTRAYTHAYIMYSSNFVRS